MSQVRLDHAERAEYTLFVGTIAAAAPGMDWPGAIFGKVLRTGRTQDPRTIVTPLFL